MAEFFNYSNSTAVRAALLHSGFYVAPGIGTGPKSETTRAFSQRPTDVELLGTEWLNRWERSGAKFPQGIDASAHASFEERIRSHPQFAVGIG